MSFALEQFGIDRLSPQQRCELIDFIWDVLPDYVALTPPDWQLRELERRSQPRAPIRARQNPGIKCLLDCRERREFADGGSHAAARSLSLAFG